MARVKARPRRWWQRGWVAQVALIVSLAAASYVLWTDRDVRVRFEGRLWSLPARVFARPLELHPGAGARTNQALLLRELTRLGYRQVTRIEGPGQYAVAADSVTLHTRGFTFGDGAEDAREAQVQFSPAGIAGIRAVDGAAIPLLRLEPLEIGRIHPGEHEDRVLVALDDVSPLLVKSVLAIEDRDFLAHRGIDPRAVLRAAWRNLRAGAIEEGGSTITQQLAKNLFVGAERSFARKLREALVALIIEVHYSKAQILEAYLNEIYLGQVGNRAIHGVGRAAQFYFGRPASELTLSEAALLAGLIRGASMYDPWRHPERALARRDVVLHRLLALGRISEADAAHALAEPVRLAEAGPREPGHAAFLNLVSRELAQDYRARDLEEQGLKVFTTLDPEAQAAAEVSVTDGLAELDAARAQAAKPLEAAVVVTEPNTGAVLALVGGRDVGYAGFNRALDARRPVGSLAKPFVYLTALGLPGYTVASRIDDAPVDLKDASGRRWTPHNYDGRPHGRVGFDVALAQSYNLAAIRLGLATGIPAVRRTFEAVGVGADVPAYPSVTLGSFSLTPFDVARAYGALANGGAVFELRAIRAVLGKDDVPLRHYGVRVRQALDRRVTWLVSFLLSRVVAEGTARALALRAGALMPLAGKTGTTDDLRDSWFAGYGADRLAVVWLGRDDNTPAGFTGAGGALRIWTQLALALTPAPLDLTPPPGVEWQWISADGLARTDPACLGARRLPFVRGTAPAAEHGCETPAPAPAALTPLPERLAPVYGSTPRGPKDP